MIAEEAQIHTGPGFGFRVVYRARQGEVLPAIGRASHDHWFRVELPDGTYGWVLGDEVFPLDVDTAAAHEGPSIWKRMGTAIFSPPPLLDDDVGFTFSAGVLGGDGMFMFRPSWLLAPHVSLEGMIGETVGNQVDVIYAGGGFNAFLFASSPVTPFVGASAGGAFGRKKADQFAVQTGNYSMLNVGGGADRRAEEAPHAARRRAPVRHLQRQPRATNPGVQRCFVRVFLDCSGACWSWPRSAWARGGCAVSKWTVRPHQRELLADRIMQLDAEGQERAAEEHILSNREGAVGGNGTSGGGCGCN